jgi:hypothetical protein
MARAEHDLQAACVAWFRYQHPHLVLFSIPNGAFLNGTLEQRVRQWKRLKAKGAVEGVADLFLAVTTSRGGGLFIEMKAGKGKQSPEQIEFEQKARVAGYGYIVCRSLDEFVESVERWQEDAV